MYQIKLIDNFISWSPIDIPRPKNFNCWVSEHLEKVQWSIVKKNSSGVAASKKEFAPCCCQPSFFSTQGGNEKQDQNLESPESANRELCVEISNDRKISHIAQVDKIVLAVKFAKGGEGLQECLGIKSGNDERFLPSGHRRWCCGKSAFASPGKSWMPIQQVAGNRVISIFS